jgi:hypothetical protein
MPVLELTGIELESAAHANAESALSLIHRAAIWDSQRDLIAAPPGTWVHDRGPGQSKQCLPVLNDTNSRSECVCLQGQR